MVIGVLGGSGGVGASWFAARLASAAPDGVLVDLDAAGGGADVPLGIDRVPGARWSDLHLDGGRLDPGTLLAGLPVWDGCPVLAADAGAIPSGAVTEVLDALHDRTVVLDLPRADLLSRAAALAVCSLVVVLVRADVVGLVGGCAAVRSIPADVPAGMVLRGGRVRAGRAAELVGVPLLGVLPTGRRRRAVDQLAIALLAGLGDRDPDGGARYRVPALAVAR